MNMHPRLLWLNSPKNKIHFSKEQNYQEVEYRGVTSMSSEIIIASDSHGRSDILPLLQKAYPNADLFLHLGDLEDNPGAFPGWVFVRGNNDWQGDMPSERVISIQGHKIYMTHSHLFPYSRREESLARTALEHCCDICLYGHTHVSNITRKNGVLLINPGSLLMPRDGNEPSYARLILHDDGQTEAEILFEDDWPIEQVKKEKKRFWFW